MEIEEDGQHYQFILDVLKALHLDSPIFFKDLANDAPYEIQIYQWIDKLFRQGKTLNDTIQLIHRVRRLYILTHNPKT